MSTKSRCKTGSYSRAAPSNAEAHEEQLLEVKVVATMSDVEESCPSTLGEDEARAQTLTIDQLPQCTLSVVMPGLADELL
ncbi:hypothetical protein NDU88_003657 [Pleurodeles waltl]|uniref:Uncharacterized protein n=1 Tax=Pleurodeles waltl TaxID=8319 RepID=A0AAV7T5K8_PLEWA|nr:hypothetical protein NDU88_003657 [Pleurodeles waltl]